MQEPIERMEAQAVRDGRGERLRRFLADEAWPQVPDGVLGPPMSKDEAALGYGSEGV